MIKKKWGYPRRIKELREERGLTQKELAKEIGVSPSSISRYERGVADFNIYVVMKLSRFFQVSSDYIFGLTEQRARRNGRKGV